MVYNPLKYKVVQRSSEAWNFLRFLRWSIDRGILLFSGSCRQGFEWCFFHTPKFDKYFFLNALSLASKCGTQGVRFEGGGGGCKMARFISTHLRCEHSQHMEAIKRTAHGGFKVVLLQNKAKWESFKEPRHWPLAVQLGNCCSLKESWSKHFRQISTKKIINGWTKL